MPLVPPYIESLEPYKAGKPIAELQKELGITRVVKLASNENPIGASPQGILAMKAAMEELQYYPNGGLDLREMLARSVQPPGRECHRRQRVRRDHVQYHPGIPVRRR